jgi:hypothetical protein
MVQEASQALVAVVAVLLFVLVTVLGKSRRV